MENATVVMGIPLEEHNIRRLCVITVTLLGACVCAAVRIGCSLVGRSKEKELHADT